MTSEYPSARRTLTHTAIAMLATSTIVLASAIVTCEPAHPATNGTPPEACTEEDQSTSCYWDATTRGNGKGKSFIVTSDGRVIYVTSPSIPRKLTPITRPSR